MDKFFDNLNIEPASTLNPVYDQLSLPENKGKADEDVDYEITRKNQYKLLEQAKQALHTAIMVLNNAPNPQTLAAVTSILSTTASINKQLLDMSKTKKDIQIKKKALNQAQLPTQIVRSEKTIVFTGTLQDALESMNDDSD